MALQPLISIALCTYNGAEFLEEQLNSILSQSYNNIEVVICDDCSQDATVPIIERFGQVDKRIKLFINDKNLGFVKNFQQAISKCNGQYIALSDQDDIWDSKKIETQINNIEHFALIYHDSELIDHFGNSYGKNLSSLFNMYQGNSPLPFFFYNSVSGHSILMKKELLSELGNIPEGFYHDRWIAFIASERGGIKYLPTPLVKYRQHSSSNTDILKIKLTKKGKHHSDINMEWLHQCAKKTKNYAAYLGKIINIYEDVLGLDRSIKLFTLLYRQRTALFYIKKKSFLSKVNYLRKISFRPPLKN